LICLGHIQGNVAVLTLFFWGADTKWWSSTQLEQFLLVAQQSRWACHLYPQYLHQCI
jgi:hypothetical protein